MPKRRRRSFTPQFKVQVVLEVLAGMKSPSEVARQHKLKPERMSHGFPLNIGHQALAGLSPRLVEIA
jgi:hypothetical protein